MQNPPIGTDFSSPIKTANIHDDRYALAGVLENLYYTRDAANLMFADMTHYSLHQTAVNTAIASLIADHAALPNIHHTPSTGVGGSADFLGLDDTPSSYSNRANWVVRVRPDATGLSFINLDNLYYTETESDARYSLLAHTHTTIAHNHDARYSRTGHTHAESTHNHDDDYAPHDWSASGSPGYAGSLHLHGGVYSPVNHTHTTASHNHDSRYYTEGQSDQLFAPIAHVGADGHSGIYAELVHSHASQTHSASDHESVYDARYYERSRADLTFAAAGHTHTVHTTHDTRYYLRATADSLYSPVTSHSHDSRYFTETEVYSRFFSAVSSHTPRLSLILVLWSS